jgi:putative ATPase
LKALDTQDVMQVLRKALETPNRGLGHLGLKLSEKLSEEIAVASSGDARAALNTLEAAAQAAKNGEITAEAVAATLQRKILLYDKSGEEHFNLISALHKSVRSSDPDAAIYWLARMMYAGEDRMYLARRLVRMAIEDIGLADPAAVQQAIACMQSVHFLGEPEGDQALAQLAIYLSLAPKSDAAYQALSVANQIVEQNPAAPVPLRLRNAPTGLMKNLGYAAGYKHAHQEPDAVTEMECLPEILAGCTFYHPSDRGFEQKLQERMRWLEKRKEKLARSVEEDRER